MCGRKILRRRRRQWGLIDAYTETAALLADEVLPALPLRQWVISFPFALRVLFASHPDALAKALEVIYRLLATHLAHKAGSRFYHTACSKCRRMVLSFVSSGCPAWMHSLTISRSNTSRVQFSSMATPTSEARD